jgi:formylglycine-generating enzyme required for sulfatase activity
MVPIPTGIGLIGDPKGKKNKHTPVFAVQLTHPFALAETETTFDQWQACVQAGGCPPIKSDVGWGRGTRPAINITKAQMQAYTRWLQKLTGAIYRLPSETEWEYAARAGSTSAYPWGDTMKDHRATCRECTHSHIPHGTTPVKSYPPNAWGLYDMHGNVWEMTEDCWHPTLDTTPRDGAPVTRLHCQSDTIKGGAWYYTRQNAASFARARNGKNVRSYTVGFRVLRELNPQDAPLAPNSAR